MRIHFILHETFEAPGAYKIWAERKGFTISETKVYAEETLPTSDLDYDMLIVMGGPQSPTEDKEQFPYYDPKAEIAFIQKFMAGHKPIVGVCLGAQLLGEAYGASYDHSPEREIGHFLIKLTAAGLADANLAHFGEQLTVGHWHGDMPGLTATAEILASSEGCPRQIIRYGDKHYAFQCHLEFNQEILPLLIAAEPDLEKSSQEHPFVQSAEDILAYDYDKMNQALYTFLDNLIQ